jgi:hypothetical protein
VSGPFKVLSRFFLSPPSRINVGRYSEHERNRRANCLQGIGTCQNEFET